LTPAGSPPLLRGVLFLLIFEGQGMSAAQIQKYAIFLAMVVVSVGIANTIVRRVPVAGPVVDKVLAGL